MSQWSRKSLEHYSHKVLQTSNAQIHAFTVQLLRWLTAYIHTHMYMYTHLHCNVETRNVETLKHDLGRVLSVLWCVEWRLSQQEVVVLRLSAEVLEDALLPEPLHEVPVLHNSVTDGVLGGIAHCCICLISNVEVYGGEGEGGGEGDEGKGGGRGK